MFKQFSNIVTFTNATLTQVLMTSESAKKYMWFDLNYNNTQWIDRTTFRIFKSAWNYLSTIMIDSYVGDPYGGNKGIMIMNGIPSLLLVNSTGQYWTYCNNFLQTDACQTNSQYPDVVLPPFDMSYILNVAQTHVNTPYFTLSYTDVTLPSITFLSLINSKPTSRR